MRPPPELRSVSVRYPWRGRLEHGMPVHESDRLRYVDEYRGISISTVLGSSSQLIERAALRVTQRAPGARLALGELSGRQGGPIPGHRSHRNGRDVDIGFYLLDESGQPAALPAFVPLRHGGRGQYAGNSYRFDVARNWTLLSKLLDDDRAHVQYVFVARALSARLLAHAEASGAAPWLIDRARTVMFEPRHGNRHQSHFHVRITVRKRTGPTVRTDRRTSPGTADCWLPAYRTPVADPPD